MKKIIFLTFFFFSLCLVLINFEEKYEEKKIDRKSR